MVGREDSGFQRAQTLPWLLVIVVLLVIAAPATRKEISGRKVIHAQNEMMAISAAFALYYVDTGDWPESHRGQTDRRVSFHNFACLYDNTQSLDGWRGPYLDEGVESDGRRVAAEQIGAEWRGLVDPWGRPYRIIYGIPLDSRGFGGIAILSSGPNLKLDTSDENALAGVAVKDDLVQVVASEAAPSLFPPS